MTDNINEFSLVELEIHEWVNVFNNLAATTENENFFLLISLKSLNRIMITNSHT